MQNNPLLPIIIALAVSVVGGVILSEWMPFYAGFGLVTIVQFIIGSITNKVLQYNASIELEKQWTQRISDMSKQTLKLKCPCTKEVSQLVPIRTDEPNFYTCGGCNKNIAVHLTAKTSLMTDIVDIDVTHKQITDTLQNISDTAADE